jgi:hypothetical protein
MGDMAEIWRDFKLAKRAKRASALAKAEHQSEGWVKHTTYHWSRDLLGEALHYWPSSGKWRWKGKTMTGRVSEFINARLKEKAGE